jgi:hypothetical protein
VPHHCQLRFVSKLTLRYQMIDLKMEAVGYVETLVNFLPDYAASHPRKRSSEDRGRRFFRNIGNFIPYYTASHHRKEFSSVHGGNLIDTVSPVGGYRRF